MIQNCPYKSKCNGIDCDKDFCMKKYRLDTLYNNSLIPESEREIKKLYTAEISDRNAEGLVFLDWEVPREITAGDYGAHDFQISIECNAQDGHGNITKRWFSNTYTNLKIGSSMFELDVEPGEPAMTVDIVHGLID